MSKTFIKIGAVEVDGDIFKSPSDRTFREAWSIAGSQDAKVIEVDMQMAREVWRNKIRAARKPKLEELDAKFMIALEKGEDTSEIVAQKQALRDAPQDPEIDNASTPEQLKKVTPCGLDMSDY